MSQQVPNIPVGKQPITTWLNRVSNAIPANRLASGIGYKIKQTAYGTVLDFSGDYVDRIILEDRGNYNANSHYGPGDIVSVYLSKTYTSSFGVVVSASAGTWICECVVPDREISDNLKTAFPGSLSASYSDYIRKDGVEYQPKNPEPETLASDTTDGNGRYWRSLGGGGNYITMSVCEDGVATTYYVDAYKSGST